MTYQVNVVARSTRISRLEQAAATGHTDRVKFQSRWEELPRKVVALDTPIYRMRNIRTRVKQKAYILDHGEPANFFKDGEENVSAQRAQHAFLVEMAKAGAASGASITRILEGERVQTEALLVTDTGVLVNGNRRLAAMRELFTADPVAYKDFEHVEVAVLPHDAKEDDLSQIETDLQIAPTGKLDYGWVEEALGLREQFDELGWTMDKARAHWSQTSEELNRRLDALDLANRYLESIGKPDRYELVKDDNLAFQALLRNHRVRQGQAASRLDAEEQLTFALVNKKALISGRVYSLAGEVDAILPKVLDDPALGIPPDSPKPIEPESTDDPLSGLPGEENPISDAALEYLRDPDNWGEIAEAAEEAYADIRAGKKQQQRSTKFMSDATKVNALVAGLSLANADPSKMSTATAQLSAAMRGISECLRQVLREHPDTRASLDVHPLEEARHSIEELLRSE